MDFRVRKDIRSGIIIVPGKVSLITSSPSIPFFPAKLDDLIPENRVKNPVFPGMGIPIKLFQCGLVMSVRFIPKFSIF